MKNPWVAAIIGLLIGAAITAGVFLIINSQKVKNGKIFKLNDAQAKKYLELKKDPLYKDNPVGAMIAALSQAV